MSVYNEMNDKLRQMAVDAMADIAEYGEPAPGKKPQRPRRFTEETRPKVRTKLKRDEAVAQMVALFSATGISIEAIAYRFRLSTHAIEVLYKPEILNGREINEMFWVQNLAQAARAGKVEAMRFALERKFGWIEKSVVTINDGESGIIFSNDRAPAIDITPSDAQAGSADRRSIQSPDSEEEV